MRSPYLEELLTLVLTTSPEVATQQTTMDPVALITTLLHQEGEDSVVKMEVDGDRYFWGIIGGFFVKGRCEEVVPK